MVNIQMIGIDARYRKHGLQITGQLYYSAVSNTKAYNLFTSKNGIPNDLGSATAGYYIEMGYNLLRHLRKSRSPLILFTRYEAYDMHYKTEIPVTSNPEYKNNIITSGITWFLSKGAVFKADIQLSKSKADQKYNKTFNAGIGVTF